MFRETCSETLAEKLKSVICSIYTSYSSCWCAAGVTTAHYMLHIPLRLSTWSFTDWHMFLLPLLWSSSCVAVAGVLCMQCSALLQLHSRLWGTRHRLLWLGADLALWLGVTGCCLSGSVRTGTKLMSLYRPIASTSEDTGLISDLYTFFYYYSNIIVRTQIHGQYLALDIHTI